MKRAVFALLGLSLLFLSGYNFWYFLLRPDYYEHVNAWAGLGLSLLFIALGVASLAYATHDNIYHIKCGVVVDRSYVPAHYVPGAWIYASTMIYIPGHHEPDDWALKLKGDNDHTGWLHFSVDVLSSYPIGSYYHRNQ